MGQVAAAFETCFERERTPNDGYDDYFHLGGDEHQQHHYHHYYYPHMHQQMTEMLGLGDCTDRPGRGRGSPEGEAVAAGSYRHTRRRRSIGGCC